MDSILGLVKVCIVAIMPNSLRTGIFEYIVSISKFFLFEFIGKRFIGKNGNGVSRSNKQKIKSRTILSEPVSKFFRNSKYNVSMRAVKTKRSSLGYKLFGIFNTTCITESRMT